MVFLLLINSTPVISSFLVLLQLHFPYSSSLSSLSVWFECRAVTCNRVLLHCSTSTSSVLHSYNSMLIYTLFSISSFARMGLVCSDFRCWVCVCSRLLPVHRAGSCVRPAALCPRAARPQSLSTEPHADRTEDRAWTRPLPAADTAGRPSSGGHRSVETPGCRREVKVRACVRRMRSDQKTPP